MVPARAVGDGRVALCDGEGLSHGGRRRGGASLGGDQGRASAQNADDAGDLHCDVGYLCGRVVIVIIVDARMMLMSRVDRDSVANG